MAQTEIPDMNLKAHTHFYTFMSQKNLLCMNFCRYFLKRKIITI